MYSGVWPGVWTREMILLPIRSASPSATDMCSLLWTYNSPLSCALSIKVALTAAASAEEPDAKLRECESQEWEMMKPRF